MRRTRPRWAPTPCPTCSRGSPALGIKRSAGRHGGCWHAGRREARAPARTTGETGTWLAPGPGARCVSRQRPSGRSPARSPERVDYRRMGLTIVQVDAFTSTPFAGNPAAVCVLPAARDERWMQDVAREMNLSETAFLLAENTGYRLRWFTPAAEVALCGHATLASAHGLWEDGHLAAAAPARFHTQSGLLTAERRGDWIELGFPPPPPAPAPPPPRRPPAPGVTPRRGGRSKVD